MGEIARVAYEMAAKDAAWKVLPIIIADTDTGEILYCSQFAADTFGYTVDELLGQTIETLIPEDVRISHSRWRQDASVPKTRLMGVGRQIHGKRKDDSIFPVHIGLTSTKALDRTIGIAFVIDLTGIVRQPTPQE